jgi:DNA-binding response OmpR family regulator/two-component sensor histidine kinase
LDISKLETGTITLQVSEGDLQGFVRTIVLSFLSLAESKQIHYIYDLPEKSSSVYFDPDKVEKILTNLISNAFKFTPAGGEVSVRLKYIQSEDPSIIPAGESEPARHVEIKVSDTGKGIPAERLDRIFDRFYQDSDSETREEEGTGIGLALTKELVELYRGEILVESEPGTGSVFTVILPVAREQFRVNEIVTVSIEEPLIKGTDETEVVLQEPSVFEKHENQVKGKEGSIILIVEDNTDLRNYMTQNLDLSYRILEAENGRTGMDIAIKNIPDLVISDLMMPEMDGMEMCKHLKTDERTSHIPIILLTAKADRDSKLEGLDVGADDYIIKPFDAEELQVRIKNLIGQRRKLRDRYRKEFLTEPANLEIDPAEEEFLSKVMKCIEMNVPDAEFTVDKLGSKLSLSRVQLYRKIIALTDHSPQELIRNTRLKLAARMFQQGHNNVSRVMYEVGFSTPSYFARCFRDLFGSNPSDYIKQMPSH